MLKVSSVFLAVAACMLVSVPAVADEPSSPDSSKPTGSGLAVAPSSAHGLGQIHGALTTSGDGAAGRSRDVDLAAPGKPASAAKPARPAATPRTLRRMSSDRVLASIDTNVRACATESTSPASTSLMMRISVAPSGEVESAELSPGVRVAPALLKCVVNVMGAARFGAPGGAGATVIVPVTIPAAPKPAPAATDATPSAASTPDQQ